MLVLARVLKVFINVEGDHKRFSPCKKVCVWGGGGGSGGGGGGAQKNRRKTFQTKDTPIL